MKNWKELFEWLYLKPDIELEIDKNRDLYTITYDKISYFPISKKMAKELQACGVEIKEYKK